MEDNWSALVIAIFLKVPPETAFLILDVGTERRGRSALDDNDVLDMIIFREEGISLREIGEMYGISESAVCKRIEYFKKHKKPPFSDKSGNKKILSVY